MPVTLADRPEYPQAHTLWFVYDTGNNHTVVDPESIERLVQFLMDRKVHGVTVLGALGEGQKLNGEERGSLIRHYRKLLPSGFGLVVGVRARATDLAKSMAVQAMDLGADGLLLGPHNVQKDQALLGYYLQVDEIVDIPLVIHDYPAVTGITMSIELIAKMCSFLGFEGGEGVLHTAEAEIGHGEIAPGLRLEGIEPGGPLRRLCSAPRAPG